MSAVASGGSGTVRWAINANAGFLLLLKQGERNKIIRDSLTTAGNAWKGAFLPKRFTNYVKAAPFYYKGKGKGFIIKKARNMGLMKRWADISWFGWDPWEDANVPPALVKKFVAENSALAEIARKNGMSITPNIRAAAKADLTAKAIAASAAFLPLVESGNLRQSAMTRSRVDARATSTMAKVMVRIPFPSTGVNKSGKPSFGYNSNVSRIIKTLPAWEVKWIANILKRSIMVRAAKASGQSQGATMGYSRVTTVDGQRATVYAEPRSN
jgi:hypothetical protein